jgi:hypothetical protein
MATNANRATNAPAATNAPVGRLDHQRADLEQRLESIEAYFQNGDPTGSYKDTNGNWTVNFGLGPPSSTPT